MAIQDNPGVKLIGEIGNPYGRLTPDLASTVANSSLEQITNGLDKAKSFAQNVSTKTEDKKTTDKKIQTPVVTPSPTTTVKPTAGVQPMSPEEQAKRNIEEANKQNQLKKEQFIQDVKKGEYKDSSNASNVTAPKYETTLKKKEDFSNTTDYMNHLDNAIIKQMTDFRNIDKIATPFEMALNKKLTPEQQAELLEIKKEYNNRINSFENGRMALNKSGLPEDQQAATLRSLATAANQKREEVQAHLETLGKKPMDQVTFDDLKKIYNLPAIAAKTDKKQVEVPQKKQEQVQTAVQTATTLGKESTTKDAQSVLDKTNKALKGMPDNTLRDVLELIAKVAKGIIGQDFETSAQKERGIERDIAKMNEAIAMEQQAKLSEETNQVLQQAKLKNLRDQEQVKYGFDIGRINASKVPEFGADLSQAGKTFSKGGNK